MFKTTVWYIITTNITQNGLKMGECSVNWLVQILYMLRYSNRTHTCSQNTLIEQSFPSSLAELGYRVYMLYPQFSSCLFQINFRSYIIHSDPLFSVTWQLLATVW